MASSPRVRAVRAKRKRKPTRNRPRRVRSTRDLVPDAHNRRKHTPRNVDLLVAALKDVGAARSIVIDERNEVLAGNGLLEAAQQTGISRVKVIDADGDTIIAVRRTGLTTAQKRDLALYDNRTAELAEWNVEQLQADQLQGADLAPFFTDTELATLLHSPTAPPPIHGGVVGGTAQFVIIVSCSDEAVQTSLLERFIGEGLSCRAVIS
jgi:hypothetical protein